MKLNPYATRKITADFFGDKIAIHKKVERRNVGYYPKYNGTENQRNEVIIIGLEQLVSSFGRVSVSLFDLFDIINAKQGIMIVRIRSESL